MTYYISLQMVLLSLALFPFKQVSLKKVSIFYAAVFLFIISIFRYGIGIDFFSYQVYYGKIVEGSVVNVEYGFIILSLLCDYLSLGFQGVVACYAFLTIIFCISFYSRFSNNILLSLYLFAMLPILYLASFNVIRQFLSVAIFAFSIRYIFERKLIIYFTFILVAAFFVHKSVLLMLPMYFLLTHNLRIRSYVVITFLYILSLQFIDLALAILGFSKSYSSAFFKNTGLNYLVLVYLFIFLFILYLKKKLVHSRPENLIFINMMFICTLISFSSMLSGLPSVLFLRVSSFFTIAMPIILVNVLPVIKNYRVRLFYFLGVIFSATLYFYVTLIFKGGGYKLTPYNNFIFN